MDFLREANFKRCFDVEDWFHNEVAVQHKIPFQMDFLRKFNSC